MSFPTVAYDSNSKAAAAFESVAAELGYPNPGTLDLAYHVCGVVANMLQDAGGLIDPGAANQVFVTNSLATAAVWSDNLSLPGTLGIGTAAGTDRGLNLGSTALAGANQYGGVVSPIFTASSTSSGVGLSVTVSLAAAAFTQINAYGLVINTPVKGAGSAITNVYGTYWNAQSGGATLNYVWYAATTTNASHLTQAGLLTAGGGFFTPSSYWAGQNATTTNSIDSVVTVNRLVNDTGVGTGVNGHAFSDSSVVSRTGTIGYNSFDVRFTNTGTAAYDHFAGFQFAPTIGTSGLTGALYGMFCQPVVNLGSVGNLAGLWVENATGTGTIDTQYGVKVMTLTKGAANYAIYVTANNSYFNGQIQIGVNTPAYLYAPSDGALSLIAAGSNKSITLTPSGSGNVLASGNLLLNGGYFKSDRTDTPAIVFETTGANYGQAFMVSSTAFALGYNTVAGTIGTAAVTWNTSAGVTLGSSGGTGGVIIDGTGFGAGVASLRLNGLTSAAGANVGTLTNSPHTGDPAFWAPINIAGTVYAVPCFALT